MGENISELKKYEFPNQWVPQNASTLNKDLYQNTSIEMPEHQGLKKKIRGSYILPKGAGGRRGRGIGHKESVLLNSNTESLKTTKQCLKNSKGYFHLCECR